MDFAAHDYRTNFAESNSRRTHDAVECQTEAQSQDAQGHAGMHATEFVGHLP
jgi:hypothetical protein